MKPSPALRIINGPMEKHTLEGRTVGILIADGTDAKALAGLKKEIKAAGGHSMDDRAEGGQCSPVGRLEDRRRCASCSASRRVTVDACAVILSKEACQKLTKEAAAVQWVMDAFGHLKAIGLQPGCEAAARQGRRRARRGRHRPVALREGG